MDEPPQDSNRPPPVSTGLGKAFWIAFWLPIALFVAAIAAVNGRVGGFGGVLVIAAGWAAFVGVFVCTAEVISRSGRLAGLLTFFGMLMLYAAIAFAGCVLSLRRI
jgi:hypothetical protein